MTDIFSKYVMKDEDKSEVLFAVSTIPRLPHLLFPALHAQLNMLNLKIVSLLAVQPQPKAPLARGQL